MYILHVKAWKCRIKKAMNWKISKEKCCFEILITTTERDLAFNHCAFKGKKEGVAFIYQNKQMKKNVLMRKNGHLRQDARKWEKKRYTQ